VPGIAISTPGCWLFLSNASSTSASMPFQVVMLVPVIKLLVVLSYRPILLDSAMWCGVGTNSCFFFAHWLLFRLCQ
jgi:hypothetical protein